MGVELILNAANINFIAFNRFNASGVLDGHVMSVFIIVLAAAEAAVALAIAVAVVAPSPQVPTSHREQFRRLVVGTLEPAAAALAFDLMQTSLKSFILPAPPHATTGIVTELLIILISS